VSVVEPFTDSPAGSPHPTVYLPSGASKTSAYALINRRWVAGIRNTGRFVVVEDGAPPTPLDFAIHHNFEEDFLAYLPPAAGTSIAARPWDFGPYPPAWVEHINTMFDQLWAPSRWAREMAVKAGVRPDRARVVPLGVDEEVFCPIGKRLELATDRRFKFLFVGGVSARKGTDVLLAAYSAAFSPKDDVCLVIKDNSGDVFYQTDSLRDQLGKESRNPASPEILYIDAFLPEDRLAALYRACDVGVFPYRAEGFCVPILEAMACGMPSVVPNFGACLDYCSDATSFLAPVRRVQLPVRSRYEYGLGFSEEVEEVDFCEVHLEPLADLLRRLYEGDGARISRRANAGVAIAHHSFTWDDSVAAVLVNLESAGTPPTSHPPYVPS
jgi:glycosyltransferase involved in cell wall biosynthesis